MYLAQKGFHLILIERQKSVLDELKDQLLQLLPSERTPYIKCAVLERFDQEYINDVMGEYSREPVKIFVNCKALRVDEKKGGVFSPPSGSAGRMVEESRDSMRDPRVLDEITLSKYEVATRAEVQYTVRENIEGYVTLVNIFLPSMCTTAANPCLINVEDYESLSSNPTDSLFYSSTVAFNEQFTNLLGKKHPNVKTINVRMDFKACKESVYSKKLLDKLCQKTFSYVGLRNKISV